METKEFSLTDICDFQGGTQPPKEEWINEPREGYVRMLQIRDFTQNKIEHIGYVKDTSKLNKCHKDDILIGRYGASVGKILTGLTGAYNVAIIKTIPNEELISKKFLFYILKGAAFQNFILTIGARAAQAGFNKSDLSSFKLRIPISLYVQDQIVNILEKAHFILSLREKSITIIDELLKNKFLEMFGDPIRNDKCWAVELMGNVITDIISGTSYGGEEKKELSSDELGVLKISAVTKGVFDSKEFKAVKKRNINKNIITVEKGMFLFSRANTKELIAACCIISEDYPSYFIPDKLWSLIIDNSKIHPIYLNYLFKNESYRNVIRKEATGGHDSMLNISMNKFRNLKLPVPNPEIQNKFAQIAENIELIKYNYFASFQILTNLYNSLIQKALYGELKIVEQIRIEKKEETKFSNNIRDSEQKSIDKIKQILEDFYVNQPHTGAPDEIENKIKLLEAELKIRGEIPYWGEYVKYRIVKGKFKSAFTFEQLWEEISKFPFETLPSYDKMYNQLFEWLNEIKPFIRQQYNETTKQIELIVNETA